MKNDYIKIDIPSSSINESFARATIGAFAARMDPNLEELNDIKTAVSEAVTNCIVHAYPDHVGMIHIVAKIRDECIIEITIKDKGVGISDIDKAREPMYTTGGDDRSGMGFTVMESFMDKIKVRSKPNSGTTVVMQKKIRRRGIR